MQLIVYCFSDWGARASAATRSRETPVQQAAATFSKEGFSEHVTADGAHQLRQGPSTSLPTFKSFIAGTSFLKFNISFFKSLSFKKFVH